MPRKIAIFAVLFVLAVAFVLQQRKQKLKARDHDEVVAVDPTPKPKPAKPNAGAKALEADTEPQQLKDAQAQFSGVGYVEDASGGHKLKVKLATRSICHAGDYEAMAVKVGNSGDILLSLEPIGAASAPGLKIESQRIPLKDIFAGASVDLAIPSGSEGIYGLYLCSDAEQSASCGKKAPADFNAILGHKVTDDNDVVFYFQLAVLKKSTALIYGGQPKGLPGARANLDEQGIGGPQLDADMAKVAAMMKRVQSLAPVTASVGEDTTIVIPVAMLGGKGC